MLFINLVFGVVLIKSLVTNVACDNRREAESAMEKRIGYEDGKITSVTVYTGDHKLTGQTSASGSSGGSGSSQSNPPPTSPKPSTGSTNGRPKPENPFGNFGFNFKPFGTFGGLGPQDLWFQKLSSLPSKIASFSDIDDYEDDIENILTTLDKFDDY